MTTLRHPKDGRDGRDGKDADPALIRRLVAAEVAKAVAALPPAQAGAKGDAGRDGRDADPAAVAMLVDESVRRAEAIRPAAKDGARGERGPKGDKGEPGEQGPPGPKPRHEWDGSKLRFEKPSGSWGEWSDLRGPQGYAGGGGVIGGAFDLDSLPSGDASTPTEIVLKQHGAWFRVSWANFLALIGVASPRLDFSKPGNSQYIGAVHI
ncbi:MAG TPA: hypothetical protein PLG77_13110 [Burkholderiaceae bacterium]|nr:hypothetical protein [Burkholderiaceae bacterium]